MKKALLGLLIILMLVGCGAAKKPQTYQGAVEDIVVDAESARQVKKIALAVDGVQQATAVVVDKEISVAAKVRGFDRLRLKSIRKEIHQGIKKEYQGYAVHVTTDKKLFKELQQLEQQINGSNSIAPQQIKGNLSKINQDMQG